MNNSEAVCFFEHVADLRCDADSFRESETTFAGQRLRECFAFDKLHHDEVSPVGQISGVEDHRGVRMAQLGHRSRFAKESIGDVSIAGEFTPDDLDRDRTFEIEVRGKVNSSHATGSNLALYSESAGDKLGDIHLRPSFGLKGRSPLLGFEWFRGRDAPV